MQFPASNSEDGNLELGADEGSSSMAVGVRKQSLRNIAPRSYSSLLKSESEEEEEDTIEKPTSKSNNAAANNQGRNTTTHLLTIKAIQATCILT